MSCIQRKNLILVTCSLLVLLMHPACFVSREEGDRILDSLRWLKRQNNASAATQKEELDKLNSRVAKLESILATKRSADAKSSLGEERLIEDLQSVKGQIEELKHEISLKNENSSSSAQGSNSRKEVALERVPLFNAAKHFAQQKKFQEALDHYREFIERFNDDKELLDQALFNHASSAVELAKRSKDSNQKKQFFKDAILSYQRLLTKFPKSSLIDTTLFKTGTTLEEMGYPVDAIVFYQEIVDKHKNSEFVAPAKKRLRAISPTTAKKSK